MSQIITQGDIEAIAEQIDNNSTAGFMLIENLWAKKTQQAVIMDIATIGSAGAANRDRIPAGVPGSSQQN